MKGSHGKIALVVLVFILGRPALAQGDKANGKRVYLADGCFTCHGRAGQGGALNYPAPALAQTKLPVEAFKALVRAGPNDMPAYSEAVLSDKDLGDIHAFAMSLPGRKAPKDYPILNQ
jgi:mono/diheme cytochrome c family protein